MACNSQKGNNSEEYKVVKKLFSSIISRIEHDLPRLANELFSRDLISKFEHGNAMNKNQNKNQNAYCRASDMIMSILTKIENDISFYSNFVSALRDSNLGGIAADLESSLSNENFRCSTFPHAGEYILI